MDMGIPDIRVLENILDKYGLHEVVSKLAFICSNKSLDIAVHQSCDVKLATTLMQHSVWLDKLAAKLEEGSK
jgi:hypothetical protein